MSIVRRLLCPLIGAVALLWLLVRVIPKPSRAAYPCQRAAMPMAVAFAVWLFGFLGAGSLLKSARRLVTRSRYLTAAILATISVSLLWLTLSTTGTKPATAETISSNEPIGIAKGIYPGRVVWTHDPYATDWSGPGDGHLWQDAHTRQISADLMVSRSVRELTGEQTDSAAWDALFRFFNSNRGKGDIGYKPTESIAIKVNLTTCNRRLNSVDTGTYEKTSYLDKADTMPQTIAAVLGQLVNQATVPQSQIAVGDTLCYFPQQWLDICQRQFPEAVYFDCAGGPGRLKSELSGIRQYWSHGQTSVSYTDDYIPQIYAQADYIINIAVLKGHGAGITLCAKNHYGSYIRLPDTTGYYDLHESLAGNNTAPAQYRALVDIMAHPHMGAKTLLHMVDGLYGGYRWQGTPHKWQLSPFDNDWPSSLLVSQDQVAIDSVGLDFLLAEWPDVANVAGVDDYLIEAAMADSPPSGTAYDPNGDGAGLSSLGVHEHWNNSTDKQYSQNLGLGQGIELLYFKLIYEPSDINMDGSVDIIDLTRLFDKWLWLGPPGDITEDVNTDGTVNLSDFAILAGTLSLPI